MAAVFIAPGQPTPALQPFSHRGLELGGLNLQVTRYTSALGVLMLDNALKRGKSCTEFTIGAALGEDERPDFTEEGERRVFQLIRERLPSPTFESLRAMLVRTEALYPLAEDEPFDRWDDGVLRIFRKRLPAIRVCSTAALEAQPRLTATPTGGSSRWRVTDVVRLLANNQFRDFVCDGEYSDDYKRDSERDYGRGAVACPRDIIDSLVVNPEWWKVVYYEPDNRLHLSRLGINHYSLTPML